MSSHFRYTEEYVLSHSLSWVKRKSKQARKEMFEQHSLNVVEGFKSLVLLVDSAFNKGQSWEKILPSTMDEAMNQRKGKENGQFVTALWWKPKSK